MDTWQEFLEFYYNKYKYNFIVQKFNGFPHPWKNYKTEEYNKFIKKEKYVSQREVFHDEVVVDIDMDKELSKTEAIKKSKQIAKVVCNRLEHLGYSYSYWTSGGCGVHIHIFFPELFNYNTLDSRMIKKIILKEIGQGFIKPREHDGRVQLQTNTTIQLEYAPHRKGGVKKLIKEYNTGQPNLLKSHFFTTMKGEKQKNDYLKKYFKENLINDKPEAITFLENESFYQINDGRDRALFILSAYYKQFLKGEELFEKLNEWNKKILKGYFSKSMIRAKIRSARPCIPYNYLTELFEELGIDGKYIEKMRAKTK